MALTADRVPGATGLTDLLQSETDVCHRMQLCNPQWILSPEESGADDFLSTLLGGSDSSPASSLWSSCTTDISIIEDFQTDPVEGLLQPSYTSFPALDTQCFPVPTSVVHHPLQQKTNEISSHVSIDLGWLSEEQCAVCATTKQSATFSLSQTVTVKDLLLSNLGHKNSRRDLVLSEDEKRLLAKEGVSLPSKLPLTKFEEKVLKKIRRKIRNKYSAQESRKKKKEYIDSLEGRVSACNAHNLRLQRKIQELEQTNSALLEQLRQLQALLPKRSSKTAQRRTCILVLLLFFSFLMSSNLQPYSFNHLKGEYTETKVPSRSLQSTEEDESVLPHPFTVSKQLDSLFSTMEKMWAWTNPQPANFPSSHHHDHSHRSGF